MARPLKLRGRCCLALPLKGGTFFVTFRICTSAMAYVSPPLAGALFSCLPPPAGMPHLSPLPWREGTKGRGSSTSASPLFTPTLALPRQGGGDLVEWLSLEGEGTLLDGTTLPGEGTYVDGSPLEGRGNVVAWPLP